MAGRPVADRPFSGSADLTWIKDLSRVAVIVDSMDWKAIKVVVFYIVSLGAIVVLAALLSVAHVHW